MATVKDLIGKTVEYIERGSIGDYLLFVTTEGEKYKMYHEQDCGEAVYIEDVNGDLMDLVGAPMLKAEERVNDDVEGHESATWTFYYFASIKGHVVIRWLGTSNGEYAEGVDFVKLGD